MATIGSNLVKLLVSTLVGSVVQAVGALVAYTAAAARIAVQNGGGTILDKVTVDFAADGYAKHGGCTVNLTGTTAVDLSLADLTSNATSYAGDTAFATWNQLVLRNTGSASLTVKTGASNGATLPLNGTGPTLTIPPGSASVLDAPAGVTVDATHKIITVTPAADGSFFLGVAGA